MTVKGLDNQSFYKKVDSNYDNNQRFGESAYDKFSKNLSKKAEQKSDEMENHKESRTEGLSVTQVDYRSGKVASELAVQQSGRVQISSVTECSVRHITYEESDHVKVCITEGYSLKAQVDMTAHSVYIEQKMEDGTLRGYEVNPLKAAEDTEDAIEQMALESWEITRKLLQGEGNYSNAAPSETKEDTEDMTLDEALMKFYDFVEDRIKNGPPKIRIGASEFSVEEWERLLKKVDGDINAMKEELRERIRKEKEKELLQRASSDTQEETVAVTESGSVTVSGSVTETEDESAIGGAAPRGSSFLARLNRVQKAPYSYLADENGCINYNGVIFICDDKKKQICLGDVSNPKDVLTIPLSKGGCLKVNRDNLGDLAKAIDMFSPEDIERIMRAIAQDTKAQQMQLEIDETESSPGFGGYQQKS